MTDKSCSCLDEALYGVLKPAHFSSDTSLFGTWTVDHSILLMAFYTTQAVMFEASMSFLWFSLSFHIGLANSSQSFSIVLVKFPYEACESSSVVLNRSYSEFCSSAPFYPMVIPAFVFSI